MPCESIAQSINKIIKNNYFMLQSFYITHYSLFVAIRFADSSLFNDLIPTMDAVTSVW